MNGRKDGELSIPGVASPVALGTIFWGNQSRIDWRGGRMDWARILAFVTGMVDQELLGTDEYLAAENRIPEGQVERATAALETPSEPRSAKSVIDWGRKFLGGGGQCGSAGHHLGLVPKLRGPQNRWFEGPSKPRRPRIRERLSS